MIMFNERKSQATLVDSTQFEPQVGRNRRFDGLWAAKSR